MEIVGKSLSAILVILGVTSLVWELLCYSGGSLGIALSVLFMVLVAVGAFRTFKQQGKAR